MEKALGAIVYKKHHAIAPTSIQDPLPVFIFRATARA